MKHFYSAFSFDSLPLLVLKHVLSFTAEYTRHVAQTQFILIAVTQGHTNLYNSAQLAQKTNNMLLFQFMLFSRRISVITSHSAKCLGLY